MKVEMIWCPRCEDTSERTKHKIYPKKDKIILECIECGYRREAMRDHNSFNSPTHNFHPAKVTYGKIHKQILSQ